jgi:hypothetical protein
MTGVRKCMLCETDEGEPHPVTGRPIERLIVNNQCTAYICFDCVSRCVEIMATEAKPDAAIAARELALVKSEAKKAKAEGEPAIREVDEPVFHAEEGIIRSHRVARHRLSAKAMAHRKETTKPKNP